MTKRTPRRGRLRASERRASEDETPIAEPSTSRMIKERATQQGDSIAVILEAKFAQLEDEEKEDTETQFNAPSTIERDSSWSVVNRQRNNRPEKKKRESDEEEDEPTSGLLSNTDSESSDSESSDSDFSSSDDDSDSDSDSEDDDEGNLIASDVINAADSGEENIIIGENESTTAKKGKENAYLGDGINLEDHGC